MSSLSWPQGPKDKDMKPDHSDDRTNVTGRRERSRHKFGHKSLPASPREFVAIVLSSTFVSLSSCDLGASRRNGRGAHERYTWNSCSCNCDWVSRPTVAGDGRELFTRLVCSFVCVPRDLFRLDCRPLREMFSGLQSSSLCAKGAWARG